MAAPDEMVNSVAALQRRQIDRADAPRAQHDAMTWPKSRGVRKPQSSICRWRGGN